MDTPAEHAGDAMQIGEVAARTELSLRSLRHWEEVGVVRPSARTEGGFRLYTEDDVAKILVVRRMKPLGFTLEEMRVVMDDLEILDPAGPASPSEADARRARARLRSVEERARERLTTLSRQLAMAEELVDRLADRAARGG